MEHQVELGSIMIDNRTIAEKLRSHARSLDQTPANLFRIKAYRRAAEAIQRLPEPVSQLIAERGIEGLRELPDIGDHLSFTIERLVNTGEFFALEEETDTVVPDEDVRSLRGIGPRWAQRLWEHSDIRTVDELRAALVNHKLDDLHLTEKRQRRWLQQIEQRKQKKSEPPSDEPPVDLLLGIDRDFQRLAAEDRLPKMAPRKPDDLAESWRPLYSGRRGGWKFRALHANNALAHRLGQTEDWVVIYFNNDGTRGKRTVVTETKGSLKGRRVVRGREDECGQHYRALTCGSA